MFVQIIEGQTSDPAGVKRKGDEWQEQLKPGAVGYVDVTAGSAADGRTISIVRFESAEAAQANSQRAEQGAWFGEMEKYYDAPPTFTESTDSATFLGGPSTDAGFVQIMKVTNVERAAVDRLDAAFERLAPERPDLLGILRVWTGPGSYVEAAYFTSEADARAAERKELPSELAEVMSELEAINANTEWMDLSDPLVH